VGVSPQVTVPRLSESDPLPDDPDDLIAPADNDDRLASDLDGLPGFERRESASMNGQQILLTIETLVLEVANPLVVGENLAMKASGLVQL